MDRNKILNGLAQQKTFDQIQLLHDLLFSEFKIQFNRALPFTDEIFDRWERAKKLGWGEGASVYDSSYIFGDVRVGKNTWIGPFSIIDGSGGLTIGNNCTISAGVHIYSHDNLKQTFSEGKIPIEREPVSIGNCTYIGPQTIIKKGIKIGNHCVIASNSFINKDVPDFDIVGGNPAINIGKVVFKNDDIEFEYYSK